MSLKRELKAAFFLLALMQWVCIVLGGCGLFIFFKTWNYWFLIGAFIALFISYLWFKNRVSGRLMIGSQMPFTMNSDVYSQQGRAVKRAMVAGLPKAKRKFSKKSKR